MTLKQAIESGKPFKRESDKSYVWHTVDDNYVDLPNLLLGIFSEKDIWANDWILLEDWSEQ